MIIDIHGHLGNINFSQFWQADAKALESYCVKSGVDKLCLSSSRAIMYDVAEGNAELDKVLKTTDRFYGYVVLSPTFPESIRDLAYLKSNPKLLASLGGGRFVADIPAVAAAEAEPDVADGAGLREGEVEGELGRGVEVEGSGEAVVAGVAVGGGGGGQDPHDAFPCLLHGGHGLFRSPHRGGNRQKPSQNQVRARPHGGDLPE